MSIEGNVITPGFNQAVSLKLDDLDKTIRQTLLKSSLYKNAKRVYSSVEALQQERDLSEEDAVNFASPVTTNGWDCVTVCRVSALNQKIALDKTYPDSIDAEYNTKYGDFSLSAKFKPWSIITGGDGRNVKLEIPFGEGVYELANGDKFDVDGIYATIYVKLNYFPLSDSALAEDGSYELKVKTELTDVKDPIATVIDMGYYNPGNINPIDPEDMYILQFLLKEWLNEPENLKKFDTLFSTVVINNLGEESDEFRWLRATSMGYAYTDKNTPESSIFGVLTMTNERSSDGLPNQLPAVNLVSDDNSCFIINREVFVKYQLLPSMPYIFEGTSEDDFVLDKAGLTITARNLPMDSIRVGLIDYYPVADKFEMTFDESYIRTSCSAHTVLSPGIVAYTTIITKQTLELDVNSAGEQVMVYSMVGEPDVINSTDIAPWISVTVAIVALIGAIATGTAGLLEHKILTAVIGIITALVTAFISATIYFIIKNCIGNGVTENIPAIEPMIKVAANQVEWPFCTTDAFMLSDITYSGSLTFSGSLKLLDRFEIKNNRLSLLA